MLSLGPPDPAKTSAAMPNPAVKGMSAAGILQHPAQFAMMSSQAGSAAAFPYVQAMQSVPLKPSTTAEQKPAAGGSGSRAGRLPRRTVLPRAFKFSSGKMTSSGGNLYFFWRMYCWGSDGKSQLCVVLEKAEVGSPESVGDEANAS
ncbi:hypothetical protein HPP92_027910 [Vanilla planifolia]|uniref:Uncharacterized protein n=1 Tax=Vanilla planifolia TaxID=51239 RepID=A0A835P7I1_VANPL|nr:hypothetical protein HPP92_027910 [Vanilla planifolia]